MASDQAPRQVTPRGRLVPSPRRHLGPRLRPALRKPPQLHLRYPGQAEGSRRGHDGLQASLVPAAPTRPRASQGQYTVRPRKVSGKKCRAIGSVPSLKRSETRPLFRPEWTRGTCRGEPEACMGRCSPPVPNEIQGAWPTGETRMARIPRRPGPGDAVHEPLRMAPRARRCANWMESGHAEVWVRVYRVFRPRRGVLAAHYGDTVEIGLGPQPVFLATDLIAPAAYRLPRRPAPRPDRAAMARRALVWRALLGAGAVRDRASLARWQGLSRARVTQVMQLLRGYSLQQPQAWSRSGGTPWAPIHSTACSQNCPVAVPAARA
jgi:hypothetical protein